MDGGQSRLLMTAHDPAYGQRARRTARQLLEVAVAIALCLVFFAGFLGLLQALLPLGISWQDLVASRASSAADAAAMNRHQALVGEGGLNAVKPLVANLEVVGSDVRTKRADEIVWLAAQGTESLHDRDGVQTSRRGEAVVRFDAQSTLQLGNNTLVIIRQPTYDTLSRTRVGRVLLMSGELRADLAAQAGSTMRLEAALTASQSRIIAEGNPDGRGSLHIKVDESGRSVVTVYDGVAVLENASGALPFGPRQYLTIDDQGNVAAPREIPSAPTATAPVDGARYLCRDSGPDVTFAWASDASADAYRLAVASDPDFRNVVCDVRSATDHVLCSTLAAGKYYWRVSSCHGEIESPPSPTRMLLVQVDRVAPSLSVALPPAVVDTEHYLLTGVTERGATLRVGDEDVLVGGDGRFARDIHLRQGVNVIVVQAIDAAGNTSYASAVVVARY